MPLDDLLRIGAGDNLEIDFEYTTPYIKSENASNQTISGQERKDEDTIFGEGYSKLYKTFHQMSHSASQQSTDPTTQPSPLHLTLKSKPVSSRLHRLYSFPFLSRDAVKEEPSRKNKYLNVIVDSQMQGPVETGRKLFAFADQLIAERGLMQTTVIAEVVVVCEETFYVKDLTNSEIIQGNTKEQTVPHVIRMEMDVLVDVVNEEEEWLQSNWRIADVDDLVGGRWWEPQLL